MYTDYEIRQIPLSLKPARTKVERFLGDNGLRIDSLDYYAGVFRLDSDEMVAGGGLCGDVIKCVAVDPALRDEAMTNRLVSHLMSVAAGEGHMLVKLFTKPANKTVFRSLGFRLLAESPQAVFMEIGPDGIESYLTYLRGLRREGSGAAIVMNANPFTLGHRYLIEEASRRCGTLYVIAVREERSQFSYAERLAMIKAGCRDLANVVVCEGSGYAVSADTFPSYFLKKIDDATDTHITLDLDIFATHIAPALGVTERFVGSEPDDRLTARYNEMMRTLLPGKGIAVTEIDRLHSGNAPVSASAVRRALADGSLLRAAALVSPATVPHLIASLAVAALRSEIDVTPKPGLVDRHDSGAHTDMDHALMSRSIDALHPYFLRLARMGYGEVLPQAGDLAEVGKEGEAAMLRATSGVNTHRGALFAVGLAVTAAAHCYYTRSTVTPQELRTCIMELAGGFAPPEQTHGWEVRSRYGVGGASAHARAGYPGLFSRWLPFYSEHRDDENADLKTLLAIMTELDDTNIYFRCGPEAVAKVKQEAGALLENFSVSALEDMNRRFSAERISPGGAADMLSLTILIYSLTH